MRSSDAARILDRLAKIKEFPDLTDDGIGADLCKIATDGVIDTIAGEQDPSGARWPELSDPYDRWKSQHYPGKPMGVLEGLMSDPDEVAGEVAVAKDEAKVTYGKSALAKQEAVWFSERREFWGLTDASIASIRDKLTERLRNKVGG